MGVPVGLLASALTNLGHKLSIQSRAPLRSFFAMGESGRAGSRTSDPSESLLVTRASTSRPASARSTSRPAKNQTVRRSQTSQTTATTPKKGRKKSARASTQPSSTSLDEIDALLATATDVSFGNALRAARALLGGQPVTVDRIDALASTLDARSAPFAEELVRRGFSVDENRIDSCSRLLAPVIRTRGPGLRGMLLDGLSRSDGPARLDALVGFARTLRDDEEVGRALVAAANRMRSGALRPVERYDAVMMRLLTVLTELDPARALGEGRALLAHPDERLARSLAYAIGLLVGAGDESVVPMLDSVIQDSRWRREWSVVGACVRGLVVLAPSTAQLRLAAIWAELEDQGLSIAEPRGRYERALLAPWLSGLLMLEPSRPGRIEAATLVLEQAARSEARDGDLAAAREILLALVERPHKALLRAAEKHAFAGLDSEQAHAAERAELRQLYHLFSLGLTSIGS